MLQSFQRKYPFPDAKGFELPVLMLYLKTAAFWAPLKNID